MAEPPTEDLPSVGAGQGSAREDADGEFAELAAAVRDHERVGSSPAVAKRPADHALYRLLTGLERASGPEARRGREGASDP